MEQGAIRNAAIVMLCVLIGMLVARTLLDEYPASALLSKMTNVWWLQGLLIGGVLALIYSLNNTSTVKGLTDKQRRTLDQFVTRKNGRLWGLAGMMIAPAVLAWIFGQWVPAQLQTAYAWVAIVLLVSSTLLFGYIPFMWNEVRRFTAQAITQSEEDERRLKLADLLANPKK